ncbi:hypothetical protein MMC17_007408 [Xylographa soralifera]|nr:hypothetical protein [Xylographa soralifera]
MDGLEIYPASGMIVVAIEAARQVADGELTVRGYRLTKLQFLQAWKVSSAPEGVETHLDFHPQKGSDKSSKTYNFALYIYSNKKWSQVCSGSIRTEYSDDNVEVDDGRESSRKQFRLQSTYDSGTEACKKTVDRHRFYQNVASYGCDFGPTHQVLNTIHYNDIGEAKASIELDGWATKVTSNTIRPHVIHPTALDGDAQLTMAAFSQGSMIPFPTMVLTNVKSLWISNTLLYRTDGDTLNVYAKKTFQGYREAYFWIAAFNDKKEPQIIIEKWRQMAVTNLDAYHNSPGVHRLCYSADWQPDLEMLSYSQIREHCEVAVSETQIVPGAVLNDLELVTLHFISVALMGMQNENTEGLAPHLSRYLEWTKRSFSQRQLDNQVAKHAEGQDFLHDDEYRQNFLESFAQYSAQGALTVAVGKDILRMILGKLNPLELLFTGDFLENFYYSITFTASYVKMATYIDLLAHKNPATKIIEIGAGTGAATTPILRALGCCSGAYEESNIARFKRYDSTDISPSFFEKAKERYQSYADRMNYTVLDIEKNPTEQGLEANQYDVVVCSAVRHATSNITATLHNIQSLLKPGGQTSYGRTYKPELQQSVFHFWPPAWMVVSEEQRKWGSLLSDNDWHRSLSENGFSGADICPHDYADPDRQTYSVIVSNAVENSAPTAAPVRKTFVIIDENDLLQRRIAAEVLSTLSRIGAAEICLLARTHLR